MQRLAPTSERPDGLPAIDKAYNAENGWDFLFSIRKGEYFVLPDAEHGFDPNEVDLSDPANYPMVSKHLFRVQNLSSKYYVFRHHLETKVEDKKELQGMTWVRIRSLEELKRIVKVRVNHLGRIVSVGEN